MISAEYAAWCSERPMVAAAKALMRVVVGNSTSQKSVVNGVPSPSVG